MLLQADTTVKQTVFFHLVFHSFCFMMCISAWTLRVLGNRVLGSSHLRPLFLEEKNLYLRVEK